MPKQPLRIERVIAYPKLKGFKIGHLNIASLPKRIEELKILLKEIPFDILCINETRLNNLIDTNTVSIPGYDILRRDRNRYGGGVAIYIRDNLVYVNRNDLMPENLEAICIEIKKPRIKPFLLSSWYRAPDLNVEIFDYFEIFLRKAEQENKDIIITGDLNCNLFSAEENTQTNKLKNLMHMYQLSQHITTPTRITSNSQSLIDIILTKVDDTKTSDSGVIHVGISDQSLVYICRKIGIMKENPKLVETRQFKHFNAQQFQNDLSNAFSAFPNFDDVNYAWETLKEIFLDIANQHAPLRHNILL